jgi:hypothetical protein
MKTKKILKKLELNKKTIADLRMGELDGIKGGASGTCDTICQCPVTNPTQLCPSCAWHIEFGCI